PARRRAARAPPAGRRLARRRASPAPAPWPTSGRSVGSGSSARPARRRPGTRRATNGGRGARLREARGVIGGRARRLPATTDRRAGGQLHMVKIAPLVPVNLVFAALP